MKSSIVIKKEIIAQYKRQYSTFSISSLKSMALDKGFTNEDIADSNKTELASMVAKAKYYIEKGYNIYGN